MKRFFDRNLRFPIIFQFILIATVIFFLHLFFTHFIDKPKYQRIFFDYHTKRAEFPINTLAESLAKEIIANDKSVIMSSLRQVENRPGVLDAVLIDCSGNIYASKNTLLTGNNILSSNTLSLSEGISHLSPALYAQVSNTGASISRDIGQTKRMALKPLPCIQTGENHFQYSVLFLLFDWSGVIDRNMALVTGIMSSERTKWALILVLASIVSAMLYIPRVSRLKAAISGARSGDYKHPYNSQSLDELDVIGQSLDEAVYAFQEKLKHKDTEVEKFTAGYSAFDQSNQAICLFSANQRLIDVNLAYENLTGSTKTEMLGRTLASMLPDTLVSGSDDDLVDSRLIDGPPEEAWDFKKNGTRFRNSLEISSYRGKSGETLGYFLALRDISSEYDQRLQLELLAKTDPLTGIYNRRKFDTDINKLIAENETDFAVGIVNIDSMKEINSEYGKLAGDAVIKEACRRLLLSVSRSNRVYRFEGDEFYILFIRIECEQELERQARAVLSGLVGEAKLEAVSIEITAGMGVAIYEEDSAHPNERAGLTLNQANLALRQAKTNGRSKVVLAKDYILAEERRKLSISLALKSSKLSEQLELSYVPKVDIRHGILTGAEAIVRWECPQIGYVSKEEFSPIAKSTGDLLRIDEWVVNRALEDAATFSRNVDGFQVSIKTSAQLLSKKSFTANLLHQLRTYDLQPENVGIEINAQDMLKSQNRLIPILKNLREEGISIYMEDFGVDYSPLTNLEELPLDALKIKKVFFEGTPNIKAIRTLVTLAQTINVPVIAEGVSSTYQLELLKDMGCDFCLGYLYSEPTPLNKDNSADAILTNWQKSIEAVT